MSVRVRPEAFGAWVSLDDGTLVAVDRTRARALGIDGGVQWDDARAPSPPVPLEAHVAVTTQCPATCSGCYQHASPAGAHVAVESLRATLDAVAAAGVFTVAFGGGEPVSRDDLRTLADEARARGLVPVVTTSGIGLTRERVDTLRGFSQVNVSHDGVGGGYRAVRGFAGASVADRAIAMLVEAGIAVGVNTVLTRASFEHVEATAAHVHALGAREVQLLRYKPAGRAADPAYLATRLTSAQSRELYPLLARLVHARGERFGVRIDCALVPFLAPHVHDASALARWGIFGCEAGRHLVAVKPDGALAPCSFRPATNGAPPASHGFAAAWTRDSALDAFRAFVDAPPEPCASCALRSVCRGGCKVVSAHLAHDPFVPDPECPRVIDHGAA